jgi:23S rRNA-intervening sequence protein
MKDFRGLTVWQRAHSITLRVYRSTQTFPREEIYGITRFLSMAMGSASELEYFLLLARDLEYLSLEVYSQIAAEVVEMRRMLNRVMSKVRTEHLNTAAQRTKC